MAHTYSQYDTDLHALRSMMTTMAGLVERQVMRAVDTLLTRDIGRIAQVLADEAEVNRMHMQSDLRCNQLIAKRQPLAVDLREILAILHTGNDLERVGDEAKKIAFKVRDLADRDPLLDNRRIEQMSISVCDMLRQAIDAFIRRDSTVATRLHEQDRAVNQLRDEMTNELIAIMAQDPASVSRALALVFIVQSLERVGDHATNIAEYVVTLVEGTDPRHGMVVPA